MSRNILVSNLLFAKLNTFHTVDSLKHDGDSLNPIEHVFVKWTHSKHC